LAFVLLIIEVVSHTRSWRSRPRTWQSAGVTELGMIASHDHAETPEGDLSVGSVFGFGVMWTIFNTGAASPKSGS
jgi:hypothetical protein